MRFLLATYGSRGDVDPMFALTQALTRRGHMVVLAGPPERAGDAAVLGIDYRGMGQSMDVFLSKNSAAFHSNTLRLARAIKRDVRMETAAQFELLAPLARDADRVVGASLAFAAPSCAEHAGRPYRFIAFAPETFASRHHPALGERRQDLPRWLNSVSWWVARRVDNWLLRAPINQGRARLAQGPAAGVRGGYRAWGSRGTMAVDGQRIGARRAACGRTGGPGRTVRARAHRRGQRRCFS